jgi:hypothetical protein
VRQGRVSFEPRGERGTGCLSTFTVTSQDGEVMWRIDAGAYLTRPCQDRFPLTYGAKLEGIAEEVEAKRLRPGGYRAEGWDGDSYGGAFIVTGSGAVVNLDPAGNGAG